MAWIQQGWIAAEDLKDGFQIINDPEQDPEAAATERYRERQEGRASTCNSRAGERVPDVLYQVAMNEAFLTKSGVYRRRWKEDDAGLLPDDYRDDEVEPALLEFYPSDCKEFKRGWAALYAQNNDVLDDFDRTEVSLERRKEMQTLKEIRERIKIGNMQTASHLLEKPGVFYVGRAGKGTYVPPAHPEKTVSFDASPLGNPFPVHRRDGKSLLDSLGEPIQTYSAEESVAKYRIWLDEKLTQKDKRTIEELTLMAKTLMANKRLVLICWCRMFSQDMPACHADVIADKVAGTVYNHMLKTLKQPIVVEDGVECWACHSKLISGPLHEVKCHYCGAWLVWDLPKVEIKDDLELVPEEPITEPLPKADIDLTLDEHKSVIAELDYEISSTKLILEYLDTTHYDAMAHAVQLGAIDLTAHDQAWKIWKDRQNVATKLGELQEQLITHARFLVQP